MYKVLLVDDEALDLEGMRTFIPWADLGMEVAEAVNNGFTAYEVLKREHIDILVTDVRMPNMTGLELMERGLTLQPHLKVIFVSGFQDFNFVKRALSLQAFNYVLKPTDDAELVESLVKARDGLEQNRRRVDAERELKRIEPFVRQQRFVQWLEQSPEEEAAAQVRADPIFAEARWPSNVVVLELNDPADADRKSGEIAAWCAERCYLHLCTIGSRRYVLLVGDAGSLSPSDLPSGVTVGVGQAVSSPEEVKQAYRSAAEALEYKMFYGRGAVIRYEQLQKKNRQSLRHPDLPLDGLFESIVRYDLIGIHDELERLITSAAKLHSKSTIHNLILYMMMKLEDYLRSLNEDLFELIGKEFNSLDILQKFETIEEIHAWIRREAYQISELLHRKRQKNRNWKLISDLTGYIQEHLHENLTLKDLANKFSFSPNYLGLLFKEETDQYFSDFLITLRMERAKDLLLNTNKKVYEVADLTGYRYLPYFSKKFRECYGMSPLEYRKKH
ncbi:response regulator [Paenibacillaceae bacterium WGS1546]|uniref:response regulator n=1 Tax=Cohnella sp. WGS1546 TaxID=3366810 RepID=UPI00372D1A44